MNKKTRVIRFFSDPNKFYLLKFFGSENKYKIRALAKNLIDRKEFTTAPFSSLPQEYNSNYFYRVRF